ncbi:hypothetical protein GCM10010413_35940 [Promicromonospora sukumoe]|uniref:Uncharacterized protein n=1 Tax=Promicromonospora sukumoe TaxID=88382 RepID=A0A7W3PDH1_9MICO|nr:hypothetical protein [Promicromonospora sukumoe]MBA8807537.1 hypothetical protein [Promicromonospora sukumoe]
MFAQALTTSLIDGSRTVDSHTVDSDHGTSICRSWANHPGARTTDTDHGGYSAVVDHAPLPPARDTATLSVLRGAAVDVGCGWAFFDGLAPAAGFVRAGLLSNLSPSWDLFEAAEVRSWCTEHCCDEAALVLGRQVHDQDEIDGFFTQFATSLAA